ncbi:uncharacterized protein UTRI_02701 [Ustilago trichophora]|uniref:Uncharacterized protein n=1 Tax=Ustilago trichophora TaxID=86804 RepID=A0A5C3END2_9BASI|nr:uncharacterized protein UTRI_02701 [Ustilago trichophora]
MSASVHRLDGSDDDEFDSVFDDRQFLDPELEESLAQAEATYTASQAVQPPALPSTSYFAAQPSHSSFRLQTDIAARSGIRRGTFVPPVAKRQRLDAAPSNLSRVAGPSKSPLQHEPDPDQFIVRDLRDEEFADKDDEQWWATNNVLDQVEEEAIRMSQQMPTSQPHTSTQNNNNNNRNTAQSAQSRVRIGPGQSSIGTLRKPPDLRRSPAADTNSANQDSVDSDEITQLRAEVERLRNAQKAQEEMVDRLKQEAYRKSGEVAVVRQNLTKLNQENSKLREREVVREQEHRAALDRLQKDQERRLQRLETETAFRRVEQDTSRRIWPSSVARLPPVGLRDVDRREESQVRAGLTTPTKANRFGTRGGSGSSGTRPRYADTTANRDEPGTPTRSAVKPAPHFPRPPTVAASASKTKAFRGLQNSFADFGPVQEKIRQQRQSPAKESRQSALAPAEWDADQSIAAGHADQDDVVMADEHQPVSPPKATSTEHRVGLHEDLDTVRAKRKEHNYLAAVSEILFRRTTIVSLLLSHSSPKAAAPASYPTNRFNPTGSHPRTNASDAMNDNSFSSTTLSRLISANLVPDCPDLLLYRYRKAVESLLTNLSRAKVLEPEEREDAFRLLSAEGTDQSIEELDFSSATMHLSHAIASSLTIMAGVLLRLCQTDLLTDVLRLASCLVSTLPRFWLDLECLETDLEAKVDEFAFLGPDLATATAEWARYPTPLLLREILVQCIDDCWLPGASRGTSASSAAIGNESDATNVRGTQRSGEDTDRLGFGDWTLSSEAREDLLHAVVQVLEAMSQCPDASLSSSHHPLRLLSRPGILHKLLHPDRSSFIIFNVVRMLSSGVSNAPLVHECLASKDNNAGTGRGGSHSTGPRANARFPVLELLVKHLVDRRFDLPESEWHPLHCGILTFLTQAALRSADTLIVLADSAALLAALIRCLSLDSDFVWLQSRPTFMLPARLPTYRKGSAKTPDATTIPDPSGANLVQATERIVMDTRLLNLLYNYPLPLSSDALHRFEPASSAAQERMGSISLATKLDQPETYSMLNGIRQSFIVALSRIAFCSEPDWMAEERKLLDSLLAGLRGKRAEQQRKIGTDGADRGDGWLPLEKEDEVEMVREEVEREIRELDRVSMLLEAIADVAGDLADMVLSPEEVDSVYDLLAEEDMDEEEEEMDVDPEELSRRQREVPSSQPQEQDGQDMGSETESEPELETRRDEEQQKRAASRGTSRSVSNSVSPKKGGKGMVGEEKEKEEDSMIDVIEIDDSD